MASDLSKVIAAVNRVGIQNVSLLARMTKMPTETIRYTMKKRFPKLGLNIRTPLNYSRMGLERYFVSLKLTREAERSEGALTKGLSTNAFLTYWCKAPLERTNLAFFAVPVALVDDFAGFLRALREGGMLEDYDLQRIEWSRHPELKSGYYDFGKGKWAIDWEKVGKADETPPGIHAKEEPSASPDVDSADIMIVKELQLDSWRNIAEIARKLGLNERTVRWHYRKHVMGIAPTAYVSWKPVTQRETKGAMGLILEFNELSSRTTAELRLIFNNFPFAWFEGGRTDGYYQVHSAIPSGHFMESVRYLNSRLDGLVSGWKTWTTDLSSERPYTIPYENFGKEGWFFDRESALRAVVPQGMRTKRARA